jgi:hypothetical protein
VRCSIPSGISCAKWFDRPVAEAICIRAGSLRARCRGSLILVPQGIRSLMSVKHTGVNEVRRWTMTRNMRSGFQVCRGGGDLLRGYAAMQQYRYS